MLVDSIEVDNHLFADGLHHGLNPDFTVDLKAGMAITVGAFAALTSTPSSLRPIHTTP